MDVPAEFPSDAAVAEFLTRVAARKEYRFSPRLPGPTGVVARFDAPPAPAGVLPGLRLTGPQAFARAYLNPRNSHKRLLLNWMTGGGKTIAMAAIAQEFVRAFGQRTAEGEPRKPVIFISFIHAETIQLELMRHPEFGLISASDAARIDALRAAQATDELQLRLAQARRQISTVYKFYGYREFANRLFGGAQDLDSLLVDSEGGDLLAAAVAAGRVRVQAAVLDELRDGLLMCDEFQHMYNRQRRNNYGLAIQYALQALGDRAPRLVLASATPLAGNALQVVNVLNFLCGLPRPLTRFDLFRDGDPGRPDLDRISRLAAGKVSYLMDADPREYPRREFAGQIVDRVPYLRLMVTVPSALQVSQDQPDLAWPEPPNAGRDYVNRVMGAPDEWKAEMGITVETLPRVGPFVTGRFLGTDLPVYSTKYAALADALVGDLPRGGKIMVYHPRIRAGGVLALGEILRLRGLVPLGGAATGGSLCGACGQERSGHNADHLFEPCYYAAVHSDMDRAEVLRTVHTFNADPRGAALRVLVGSNVIGEGVTLKEVQWVHMASMPDYPRLVQVVGRAVRRNSHQRLPPEQRRVTVRVWCSASELDHVRQRGAEYLTIQQVERAMRRTAVDGCLTAATPDDSLESLAFAPMCSARAAAAPPDAAAFDAQGLGVEEADLIVALCRTLLRARPVWTYRELLQAVRENRVGGVAPLASDFAEGNFACALEILARPGSGRQLVKVGDYLVHTQTDADTGLPIVDVESYLRAAPGMVRTIDVSAFVAGSASINSKKETGWVAEFARLYVADSLIHSLHEVSWEVHELLAMGLVDGTSELPKPLAAHLRALYRRFGMISGNAVVCPDRVRSYTKGQWGEHALPASLAQREESTTVGYMESDPGRFAARFKLRPGRARLRAAHLEVKDQRMLARGATCATRPRPVLEDLLDELDAEVGGTTQSLCRAIAEALLEKHNDKLRWIYLPNERAPDIPTLLA